MIKTLDDLDPEVREIFQPAIDAGIPISLVLDAINEIEAGMGDAEPETTREAWVGPAPEPIGKLGQGLVPDDVYSVLMEAARRRPKPDKAKRVGMRASAAFPKLSGFTVPCLGPGEVYVLTLIDDHNADLLQHGHEAFIHEWLAGRDLDRMLLYWKGTATTYQERGRFILGVVHARADLGKTISDISGRPVSPDKVGRRDHRMIFDLDGRIAWQRR